MTCIVGLVDGDSVWIGGDSAGVAGLYLDVRADQKVFRNGPMLFGFTTSFRMGQLLRYALTIPDHDPRVGVEKFMVTTFVDAVRECLKTHGWASKENEHERGGTFLVAYRGQLFMVAGDYQVGLSSKGFDAVGCGAQVAKGALSVPSLLSSEERIVAALRAAEQFSAGVRGPFTVMCLKSQERA
jgi:hypothetical protein